MSRSCLAIIVCMAVAAPAAAQPEVIAEIRVHGNHTTPDADILAIGGLARGQVASDERLREAERTLRDSGRFAAVDVRRRFASIADPSAILVVVLVDEHPAVSTDDLTPGPFSRIRSAAIWLPILNHADGYGVTYGARVSMVDALGNRSRVSVPLTWGGERRAAVEAERTFEASSLLLRGTLSMQRRVNPHYELADLRREARVEAERPLAAWLRAGASARVARVDFGGDYAARHSAAGVHATFDTRLDPAFPRDAIHARLAWEHLWVNGAPSNDAGGSSPRASRWTTDVRVYAGLPASAVLALRAQAITSGSPLPPPEQVLLGGSDSLRGYHAGHRSGDNMVAASVELRVPMTSPLSTGRFGVKAFVDTGSAWASGERLRDRRFDRGIGGGIYMGVAALVADADVAWPEHGRPRVHVGVGVSF